MNEAVSDILIERAAEADGFSRTVVMSLLAHGVLLTALVVAPKAWLSKVKEPPPDVMTITLAGSPGPETGGFTPLPGRQVQEVAEPTAKPVPTAPAPKPPEMVAPEPTKAPPPKAPVKPVEKPAEKSATRKPTTGAEVKTGASNVDTGGAPIPFGGLSTGGQAYGNAKLDVSNFCCPGYIGTMQQFIRTNWQANQGMAGFVTMKFTIQRDGQITDIEVEQSANPVLDAASKRSLLITRLPPLPKEYPEPKLVVHLLYEYKR
jgi:outer membrane biosynthesis protein TonB